MIAIININSKISLHVLTGRLIQLIGNNTKIRSSSKDSTVVNLARRIKRKQNISRYILTFQQIWNRRSTNKYNCNKKTHYAGNKPILKRMLHKSTSTYL